MKKVSLILALLTSATISNAQTTILTISPEVRLPKDSLASRSLTSSLNQFLIAAQADASKNDWVYEPQFLETTLLLDEIEGLHIKEETVFYRPVLLDVSPLEKDQFFIQVSYVGTSDEATEIRAIIELIAYKSEDRYVFSSTMIRNTKNWKTASIENYTFHYRDTFNVEKSKAYIVLSKFYDQKINVEPKKVTFYLLEDGLRSQSYFGLPYKSDYNGRAGRMSWRVLRENEDIYFEHDSRLFEFDPHDLWHARLSRIVSRRKVNHAMDEAIATLYGGSWGFTWEELFIEFQKQIAFNKKTDWLALREQRTAYVTDGRRNPTDFMVNALFVQKIENEQGFPAVLKLLHAKETEAYFSTLEELTGITKKNYNKEVWKLVKQEWDKVKSL